MGEAVARWGDLADPSTKEASLIALAATQELSDLHWGDAADLGELRQMEKLAKKIPLEFCSMDMYNTAQGVAFGECTIHPGAYKSFNREWDEKLGLLYQNAKKVSDEDILVFFEEYGEYLA